MTSMIRRLTKLVRRDEGQATAEYALVVVAAAAVLAIRTVMDGAVPMLLSLAGFFFGLLLLEPLYFRSEPGEVT